MTQETDVTVCNEGTVYLFICHTQGALLWCENNLPEDAPMMGACAYVVEHRYARDITQGMLDSGLTVV